MTTSRWNCVALSLTIAVASACSSGTPAKTSPPPQELWGEIKPAVSVKELMHDVLDPASDYVFNAVSAVSEKGRIVETVPTTDADWDRIRMGAVTMAEGASLLKVPRPFAPEGDNNDSDGPEPLELSPAQILDKLKADPVLWEAKVEALRNVSLSVMDIVKRRDTKALWEVQEDLDAACENCHLIYWYPNQKGLLDKADRHLEELYGGKRVPTVK